ncbi:hypothetical protein Tco_0494630 [Tanacetum coccineum]
MSSPHKPLPKPLRVAKMFVNPVWRRKLNYCNSSNEVDVNLPTPMLKPQYPLKEPSQENTPTTYSNHVSLQSHSLPLSDSCDTNVGQASIPPQSINQTQLTQPSFPHLLINLHVTSVLHAQTLPSPQGDNQTQPPFPLSPSREMLIDDINQLQYLSNLLAIHLSQRNSPSSPYSLNLPHTLNLNQVEHHIGYCPYCIFNQKQFLTLSEDLNWIEFLLTRPQPPLQVQHDYPQSTTFDPNSPPTTN